MVPVGVCMGGGNEIGDIGCVCDMVQEVTVMDTIPALRCYESFMSR